MENFMFSECDSRKQKIEQRSNQNIKNSNSCNTF